MNDGKRDWLNDAGCFKFGRYANDRAENIAVDDPSYIRWIIEGAEDGTINISQEDVDVLQSLLNNRGRLGRQRR